MIILSCIGCHLHWLAVILLPVALWVMKIFRHKNGECPCDCHVTRESLNKEVDELLGIDKRDRDDYIEKDAKVMEDSKTGKPIKIMIPKK